MQARLISAWPFFAIALAACSRTGLEFEDPSMGSGGDAGFGGGDDDAGGGQGGAGGGIGGSDNRGGGGTTGGNAGRGGTGGVGGTTGGRGGTAAGGAGGIATGGTGGITTGGTGGIATGGAGGIATGGTGGIMTGGAGGRGGSGGIVTGGAGGVMTGGTGGIATGGAGGVMTGGAGGVMTGGTGGTGMGGLGGTGGAGGFGALGGSGGTAGGAVDAGPVCGNGVMDPGEQCDLGGANSERPAFSIAQMGFGSAPVLPVDRVVSAVTFYGLSSSSSHTGLEALATSRIYLYRDTTSGILSLILHHGIDRNTSGQSQPSSHVVLDIAGLPVTTVVAVSDDSPTEFFKASPNAARGVWDFQNNSDGGVLSGFPIPGSWTVSIAPQFSQGITSWQYVDGTLGIVGLALTSPMTITAFDSPAACRTNCTVPRCGDGILDGGEVCDDGNVFGGDGCSADCKALN